MPAVSNPKRTPVFRLLTIASSGIGSFILGIWGLKLGLGGEFCRHIGGHDGRHHGRALRAGGVGGGNVLLRRRR